MKPEEIARNCYPGAFVKYTAHPKQHEPMHGYIAVVQDCADGKFLRVHPEGAYQTILITAEAVFSIQHGLESTAPDRMKKPEHRKVGNA